MLRRDMYLLAGPMVAIICTNKILGGVTAFYGFVISPGGDTPPEFRGYGLRFRQNSCSIARYNEALSLYQRLHTLWQGTTSGTG